MKLFIAIITLILSLLVNTELIAQFTNSAVMTIRAEILPASQIESNINPDLTDQIVKGSEVSATQKINIGEFTLRVPEGVEYSMHIDQHIEMSDGKSGWNMNSYMSVGENMDGETSYQINASPPDTISTGYWQGEQVATIEYY